MNRIVNCNVPLTTERIVALKAATGETAIKDALTVAVDAYLASKKVRA